MRRATILISAISTTTCSGGRSTCKSIFWAVVSSRRSICSHRATIYEDAHIFADNLHQMGLMSTRDLETYMGIFRLGSGFIPRPDLLIYLRASVPTLTAQIRKRGRDYEMNIDEDYLCRLNTKYEHWVNDIYDGEVLLVDKDTEDFVENPAVLEKICRRIDRLRNEQKR